jgi:hypothetical protein
MKSVRDHQRAIAREQGVTTSHSKSDLPSLKQGGDVDDESPNEKIRDTNMGRAKNEWDVRDE